MQTFWEKSIVVVCHVATEKPTISELVISFYELDSVAFRETQFIGASSLKIVCMPKIFVSITGLMESEGQGQGTKLTYHDQGVADLRP